MPPAPLHVLFVCLGNICRSPLAEEIFRHRVQQKGWQERVTVDSAGTSDQHVGEQPDLRARRQAARHGLVLAHRGQHFVPRHLAQADYVLAMDRSNYRQVMEMAHQRGKGQVKAQVFLMRHFDPQAPDHEVPDPYYGGEQSFREVYEILQRSCQGFLNYLLTQHRSLAL